MMSNLLPTVLCVDDEPQILKGLELTMRRLYTVVSATSGDDALEILKQNPETAVIVSDMRMPQMNGVAFLAKSKEIAPDATRLLLTGQADLDGAIEAINDGHIFRFLSKPCSSQLLLAHLAAAHHQHQLVTAERVLLQRTLYGSINMLTDILEISSPSAFGKANRIRDRSSVLGKALGLKDVWQLEIAAMLSRLGSIILPKEVQEKCENGSFLTSQEKQMMDRVSPMTDKLLANIPRLELIRSTIITSVQPPKKNQTAPWGSADVLRLASRWEELATLRKSSLEICRFLLDEGFPEAFLQVAAEAFSVKDKLQTTVITLDRIQIGMRIAEDFRTQSGLLIVPLGYVVSESFLERLRNMNASNLPKTVLVT